MRAACEACGELQPPDWKPGEPCVHCGRAVRRDVRCFWCAKRTPFAKFCRSCGAEVVEETLYGAARMLKDAGTDRFTVPKMLRELDRDQIDNFTRIYQRHAVAVARHVDEVRFLERFLFQKTFSAALEDALVPQLPWSEEALERYSAPPLPPGDDRSTARAVAESSPFPLTRQLAALARVRLDDWKAVEQALPVLASGDPALRAEAALVLTGWRVRSGYGGLRRAEGIVEELGRSPFRLPAAVRLGLLGRGDPDLLREALASPDRETAFSAALVLGDIDRLRAALDGDDLEKIAAGNALIRLGVIKVVEEPIRKSPLEVQRELVDSLARRKEAAPEMTDTLLEIVETTEDDTLRERAARVLCRKLDSGIALRIARAAEDDRHIFQSLLGTEAAGEVALFLLENGRFTMSQYGLKEAGERGAIPDGFVPARFGSANAETRLELLRLAEVQLEARRDEALHVFVMNVVFGPYDAKTRAAAWWCLHRGYRSLGEHRGEGPFRMAPEPVARFFGSSDAFAPKLAAVLRDPATLKEVGLYEFLAHLFGSAEPTLATHDLVRALLEAVQGDYWAYLIDAMIDFLGAAGADPRWRDEAIAGLETLEKKGNYHWDRAIRRLRLSAHGVPDEPDWPKLPSDFVPERFDGATPEGRLVLLRVAEEQLIHGEHPPLLRFLVQAAFGPREPEARSEAMRIWSERGGHPFRLSRAEVEAQAGPWEPFLKAVAAALRSGEHARFLEGLLREPCDPEAGEDEEFVEALRCSGRHERLLRRLRPPPAPSPTAIPVPVPIAAPSPTADAYALKAKEAERLGKELQEAAMRISFGPGTPEEKTREVMRLQAEFQERLRKLYGA